MCSVRLKDADHGHVGVYPVCLIYRVLVATSVVKSKNADVRACRVYQKAGFEKVAEFIPEDGAFVGLKHWLMIKKV
jgi:hypothetical protein